MYETEREHHLFAFYGTGEHDDLVTDFAGTVQIRPVSSELELRMQLPPLEDAQSRIAFLVPWRTELPMDVAGRFALRGRVRAIGKEQRLRRIFRVERVEDEVLASPLVGYLLSSSAPALLPCRKSVLTLDEMWS